MACTSTRKPWCGSFYSPESPSKHWLSLHEKTWFLLIIACDCQIPPVSYSIVWENCLKVLSLARSHQAWRHALSTATWLEHACIRHIQSNLKNEELWTRKDFKNQWAMRVYIHSEKLSIPSINDHHAHLTPHLRLKGYVGPFIVSSDLSEPALNKSLGCAG